MTQKEWYQKHKIEIIKRAKEHYLKNKQEISIYHKEYYLKNKEKILQKSRDYFRKHKKEIKVQRKGYFEEYHRTHKEQEKEYREINKEKLQETRKIYRQTHKKEISKQGKEYGRTHKKEINEYNVNRRKNNINVQILHNLRTRLYKVLNGHSKSASTMKLLGCSIEFFKNYYESKFTKGMTWEKVMNGEIHIDHIRPCAKFDLSKPSEQRKCFYYTNLQPLWAKENLKKAAKII